MSTKLFKKVNKNYQPTFCIENSPFSFRTGTAPAVDRAGFDITFFYFI